MRKRKERGKHHNSLSPFSAKILCGDCGGFYGSKVWHSTSKYKRTIWQCNRKFKNDDKCSTPHLYEDDIKELFLRAFSRLLEDRTALIDDCRLICSKLTDFTKLEEKSNKYLEEMEIVSELTKKLISENACGDLGNEEYNNKYTAYTNRFEKAKAEYDKLQKTISERKLKAESVSGFMLEVSELPMLPMEFNEKLWNAVIDTVTVYNDDRVIFKFKNGKEIEEML